MKFTARGRVTLNGVVFEIEAKNQGEAWVKAIAGVYESYTIDTAETVDCKINPSTLESDE